MKYIIELPDEFAEATKEYWDKTVGVPLEPYTEPNYCKSIEDESYDISRYKSIGLAFLKWLGSDTGDKLKSADDVYRFLDKNCYNKDAVEQEVWEFARKMISTSGNEVSEMWGCATNFGEMMHNTTYSEAKSKYEKWLEQRNEIKVGDEVIGKGGYKGIATYVYTSTKLCDVLWDDGSVTEDADERDFSKTGRYFPEVAELLKKMKESALAKMEDSDK